ncbi:MAG: DoxX family membrane protein [Patescibacteria group bacterium]
MIERIAHVDYVLSEQEHIAYQGADYAFISAPFLDPWNLTLFGAAIAFIGALIFAGHKVPALKDRIKYFRGRARSYQDFIPWILRFSLGVALIGAGSQSALISPAVQHQPAFATLQIILGFLMIAGLALTPTILCSLALSIGALILHPGLINNLEIIASLIAVLLLGQAKPSVDDLIGIPTLNFADSVKRWIPFILRFGLGFSLAFMAIAEKFFNPHLFGTVVENYGLTSYLPLTTGMWVASAMLIELCLGVALLLGIQTRIVSAVTFLVLSLTFFIFSEEVYAHVTIFGALFVLIVTGGGHMSLDNYYAKQRQRG